MLIDKYKNIPENDKCILCKNYITIKEIEKGDFEIVINKRNKKKQYFHRSCFERRNKNERGNKK